MFLPSGPLLVGGDVWAVLCGIWWDTKKELQIGLYINLRAPHWQNFLAASSVPYRE